MTDIDSLLKDPTKFAQYLAEKQQQIETNNRLYREQQRQQLDALIEMARAAGDQNTLTELLAVRGKLGGTTVPVPSVIPTPSVSPASPVVRPTESVHAVKASDPPKRKVPPSAKALEVTKDSVEGILRDLKALLSGSQGIPEEWMELRGLFCETKGLQARYERSYGCPSPLIDRLEREIRDSRAVLRDVDFSSVYSDTFTPEHWDSLAECYHSLSLAWEVVDWYRGHRDSLTEQAATSLLNPVAASQQAMHRLILQLEIRDPLVGSLYNIIRDICTTDRVYLSGLSRSQPETVLQILREQLPDIIENTIPKLDQDTQRQEAEKKKKEETKVKRESLIVDIQTLVGEPHFTANLRRRVNRQRLLRLLSEAKDLKIPPSEPRLRDVLVPLAETFLANEESVKEFYREAKLEQERRSAKEDVTTTESYRQVIKWARGKRILVVGGDPEDATIGSITRLLSASKLSWMPGNVIDTAPLNKAEVIVTFSDLVKPKLMSEIEKNTSGKTLVEVKDGYGVSRLMEALKPYVKEA